MSRRRDRRSEKGQASTPGAGAVSRFPGTTNPRLLRALRALLRGPVRRSALDSAVGASNGPEYVRRLRELGLKVPCELVEERDRDGNVCRPGVYSLDGEDRAKVTRWAASDPDAQTALALA